MELIKEIIQSWNWYVINMNMLCRFIQCSALTFVKFSWIIINLDFQIERNSHELCYFEQPSINHLSKNVSCQEPISNRMFGKFASDLTSLPFIFSLSFHPLVKRLTTGKLRVLLAFTPKALWWLPDRPRFLVLGVLGIPVRILRVFAGFALCLACF